MKAGWVPLTGNLLNPPLGINFLLLMGLMGDTYVK